MDLSTLPIGMFSQLSALVPHSLSLSRLRYLLHHPVPFTTLNDAGLLQEEDTVTRTVRKSVRFDVL